MKRILKNKMIMAPIIAILIMAAMILISALSCLIPKAWIRNNIVASAELMQQEGTYPMRLFNTNRSLCDNYTDAVTLSTVAGYDSGHPFATAIHNEYYMSPSTDNQYEAILKGAKTAVSNPQDTSGLIRCDYNRYWIMMIPLLRIAFIFTDIAGIRMFIFVLIMALFTAVSIKLYKRLGSLYTAAFVIVSALFCFMPNALCLAYVHEYVIAYIAMLIVLGLPQEKMPKSALVLFFAVGAAVFFVGFPSATLISLGLPLTVYVILNSKEEQKWYINIRNTLFSSLSWCVGVGLSLLAKQVLAIAVAKDFTAFTQIAHWTGTNGNTYGSSLRERVIVVFDNMLRLVDKNVDPKMSIYITIGVIIAVIAVWFLLTKDKKHFINSYVPLLIVAAYPCVWTFVFSVHAGHTFVTFIYMISVYALLNIVTDIIYKIKNSLKTHKANKNTAQLNEAQPIKEKATSAAK